MAYIDFISTYVFMFTKRYYAISVDWVSRRVKRNSTTVELALSEP